MVGWIGLYIYIYDITLGYCKVRILFATPLSLSQMNYIPGSLYYLLAGRSYLVFLSSSQVAAPNQTR